jgi:hypothetical protein
MFYYSSTAEQLTPYIIVFIGSVILLSLAKEWLRFKPQVKTSPNQSELTQGKQDVKDPGEINDLTAELKTT